MDERTQGSRCREMHGLKPLQDEPAQPAIPAATDLPHRVYRGWNCVWCQTRLLRGAVLAGRAIGFVGAHDMSTDVYACADCVRKYGLTDRPGKART